MNGLRHSLCGGEGRGGEPKIQKDKFKQLGTVKLKSGKIVHAWALEHDWSGLLMCKSWVDVEWPPKTGKMIKIPEVDKGGFFSLGQAKKKMNAAQWEFIERLMGLLNPLV